MRPPPRTSPVVVTSLGVVTALLGALVSLASPTSARADPPAADPPAAEDRATAGIEGQERRVRALLLGPDAAPDRATLERVAPDAEAVLLRYASDGGVHPLMRDRALVALGAFPSEPVAHLFTGLLAARTTREITRHKVLLAYSRAFGARAVPVLAQGLRDARPAIRMTAIEALARLDDPAAQAALEAAARRPQTPAVDRALIRALRQPGGVIESD